MKYPMSVVKLKASLARYRAIRGLSSLLLLGRPTSDRVYLWPPFGPEDGGELNESRQSCLHYLHNLDIVVCYFRRDQDGLTRHLFDVAHDTNMETGRTDQRSMEVELKRAKYCAVWKYGTRPRAQSLTPHLYIVVNTEGGHFGSQDWLRLVSNLYRTRFPLKARRVEFPTELGSCAILGSGPSVERFVEERGQWDGWIGANFLVCDERIWQGCNPIAICLADPMCFSPLPAFHAMRTRLFQRVLSTHAALVTFNEYAPFIELNFPENIKRRCHYVQSLGQDSYRLTTRFRAKDLTVTRYGNVLTDLMLPLAASLSRKITLYGCDGMPPGAMRMPKSASMDEYDIAILEKFPKLLEGFQAYIDNVSVYTGFVVDECRTHGLEITLRCRSWNSGLSSLPVWAETGTAFPNA